MNTRTIHVDIEISVEPEYTDEQVGEAVFNFLASSEEPIEVFSVDGWEIR